MNKGFIFHGVIMPEAAEAGIAHRSACLLPERAQKAWRALRNRDIVAEDNAAEATANGIDLVSWKSRSDLAERQRHLFSANYA